MSETSLPLTRSGTVLSAQSAGINASATDISVFSGPIYDYLYVLTPGYKAVQAYMVRGPGDFYMMQQFNLSCMPSEVVPNKGFVVSCRLIHDARAYSGRDKRFTTSNGGSVRVHAMWADAVLLNTVRQ